MSGKAGILKWSAAYMIALTCLLADRALAEGPSHPGQVVHGFDYASVSVSRKDWKTCQQICDRNGACKVWSVWSPEDRKDSVCFLKHTEGTFEPYPIIDSGLRTRPAKVAGGAPEQGYGYEGHDFLSFQLGRNDWQACASACDRNGACKAWSLYSPEGDDKSACWLKTAAGKLSPVLNTDSGLKTMQAALPDPGKQMKGKAFNGRVVIEAQSPRGDAQACKMKCEINRQCVAWSLFDSDSKSFPSKCHGYGWAGDLVRFKNATSAWRGTPVIAEVAAPVGDEMLRWRALEDLTAEFAPVVSARVLTAAEKNEIAARELAYLQGGSFENYHRLDALARSGDKAAMKALVNVLLETGWNQGWPRDFPYKIRAAQSFGKVPLERPAALALAGRWGVLYWQMHGGDPRVAHALNLCRDANKGRTYQYDCGFTVAYNGKSTARSLHEYAYGDTKTAPQLTLTVHPPASAVEMEQFRFDVDMIRYEQLLKARKFGQLIYDRDKEWMTNYAAAMGLTESMNATIAAGQAVRTQIAAQDAQRRRQDLQSRWDALYRQHGAGLTDADRSAMEYLAATFEDEKLLWFSDTYGLTSRYALDRLCAMDTASARCQNQTAKISRAEADAAALASAVAAHNAGVDAARQAGLTSSLNMVKVRTYNANGIYTGTTTMTQTQAEIVGARPQ